MTPSRSLNCVYEYAEAVAEMYPHEHANAFTIVNNGVFKLPGRSLLDTPEEDLLIQEASRHLSLTQRQSKRVVRHGVWCLLLFVEPSRTPTRYKRRAD